MIFLDAVVYTFHLYFEACRHGPRIRNPQASAWMFMVSIFPSGTVTVVWPFTSVLLELRVPPSDMNILAPSKGLLSQSYIVSTTSTSCYIERDNRHRDWSIQMIRRNLTTVIMLSETFSQYNTSKGHT